MRSRAFAIAVVVAVAGMLVSACAGSAKHPGRPTTMPRLGRTDANTRVAFDVVLPIRGDQVDAFMAGENDPRSPHYGQRLTADEFGRRFGLGDAQLDAVRHWLVDGGLTVPG